MHTALLIGGSAAQLVQVLSIPLLASLYGPDGIGLWGQFSAILAIIFPLSTGKIEQSVACCGNVHRSKLHAAMACFIVIFVAGCSVPIVLILSDSLAWSLLPACIVTTGIAQIAIFLWLRLGRHNISSIATFVRSIATVAIQTALSFSPAIGLQAGRAIGECACLLLASTGIPWRRALKPDNWRREWSFLRPFILFQTPQSVLNTLGGNAHILLIGLFFPLGQLGAFFLVSKIYAAPVRLLSSAMNQATLVQLSTSPDAVRTTDATTLRLLAWTVLACTILACSLPFTHSLIPDSWASVPGIALAMLPWILGAAINGPTVSLIAKSGWQKQHLRFEIITSIFRASILLLGCMSHSLIATTLCFSLSSLVTNVSLVLLVRNHARSQL